MTLHDTIKTLVKYILMTALVVLIGIKIHMSLAIGLVMFIILFHLGGLGVIILKIGEEIDELKNKQGD